MRQQDLVWVSLAFSNLKESKVRPAVIVSNNNYNDSSDDVVVCAVTSNIALKEYCVLISQASLSNGKLPIKSKIRADKIMQIEKSVILRSFATLNDSTFEILITELMKLLKSESSKN